jgi:predicted HTH domain antitoxin
MRITLDLPDDVAESLARNHQDVSRAVLENIAIEGCRSGTLSVGQAAELLGTSHNEVDGLLKRAGVYLDYTLEDLEADRETYRRLGL